MVDGGGQLAVHGGGMDGGETEMRFWGVCCLMPWHVCP